MPATMQARKLVKTPLGEKRVLKQFQRAFYSKAEVQAYWSKILAGGGDAASCSMGGLSRDFKIGYAPGNGWRYSISLARPSDARSLSQLSDEFVQAHREFFDEYRDVAPEVWNQYLGLPTEAARGQLLAVRNINPAGQSSRLSVHAFKDGGCVLKCEAERVPPPKTSPQRPHAAEAGAKRMVGYVHFTFEDQGTRDTGPRHSKRLKQRRGERTGEYTKVNHLVVASEHRGLGLAHALLTAMLECVRCLEPTYTHELFLTAMQRNSVAVRLYERLGLQVIGENVTHLSRTDSTRPIVWYQLGFFSDGSSSCGSPRPCKIARRAA